MILVASAGPAVDDKGIDVEEARKALGLSPRLFKEAADLIGGSGSGSVSSEGARAILVGQKYAQWKAEVLRKVERGGSAENLQGAVLSGRGAEEDGEPGTPLGPQNTLGGGVGGTGVLTTRELSEVLGSSLDYIAQLKIRRMLSWTAVNTGHRFLFTRKDVEKLFSLSEGWLRGGSLSLGGGGTKGPLGHLFVRWLKEKAESAGSVGASMAVRAKAQGR